ncbi:hypothetical protein EDB19DRAFT_1642772, partial [Suillus lakei]
LHFACNRLSPTFVRAFLYHGSWSCHNLIDKQDFFRVVTKTKKRKRKHGIST